MVFVPASGDWVPFLWDFVVLVAIAGPFLWYRRRLKSARRWPRAMATIHKGALASDSPTSVGSGFYNRTYETVRAYMGYSFFVQEQRYAGIFGIAASPEMCERLFEELAGQTIEVRYKPADPDNSYVADFSDSRFSDAKITQSPDVLRNAPTFDLARAME
jgi:hypothetical protein